MKIKVILVILLFASFVGGNIRSQEVSAIARFDTTDILIGDQIQLNISFTMPLDYRVIWPFYRYVTYSSGAPAHPTPLFAGVVTNS